MLRGQRTLCWGVQNMLWGDTAMCGRGHYSEGDWDEKLVEDTALGGRRSDRHCVILVR